MKKIFALIIQTITIALFLQTNSPLIANLKLTNTLSLTASQSYTNDYQSGERSSFDVSLGINGKNLWIFEDFMLDGNYKFALGFLFEKSSKFKKERTTPSDNELFVETILKYKLGWKLDPYISFNLRSILTEALKYSGDKKITTADFWDPVTTQEGLGFAFLHSSNTFRYELRNGISLMQIRAMDYTNLTDDTKTRDVKERYKVKTGIEIVNNLNYKVNESVTLNSTLSLFGDFDNLNVWVVRQENEMKVQVFKYLGILIKVNINYNHNQITEPQYQQNLRIGFLTEL